MHGNRVAAMELHPITIAGTDRAYLAGADCRAHHAAGTDRRAYLAGTDCGA